MQPNEQRNLEIPEKMYGNLLKNMNARSRSLTGQGTATPARQVVLRTRNISIPHGLHQRPTQGPSAGQLTATEYIDHLDEPRYKYERTSCHNIS